MRALNQPTSWWGWHWEPPVPMSIIEIVNAGNLNARLAAMLWIAMERGASLIVAAEPPSSGKTTTLSALLAFTPPDTVVSRYDDDAMVATRMKDEPGHAPKLL